MSDRNATPAPKAYQANVFWGRQDCATLSAQVYLIGDADSFIAALQSMLSAAEAERDKLRLEVKNRQHTIDGMNDAHWQLVQAHAQLRADLEAIRGQQPVEDLACLVRRLVHQLRKAAPAHDLPEKAMDYLKRKGLQGSPYRAEIAESLEREAKKIYESWSDQPEYVPWVEGGNSFKQDEARRIALLSTKNAGEE